MIQLYDTSNYRFTVPTGKAGYYQFGFKVTRCRCNSNDNI